MADGQEEYQQGSVAGAEVDPAQKSGAIGNLILVFISVVELSFCAAVLADGNSLIITKGDVVPIATIPVPDGTPGDNTTGISFAIPDFTRWPYGIGAHHDTMGVAWSKYTNDKMGGGKTLRDTIDQLAVRQYGSYAQVSNNLYTELKTKMATGHTQFHLQAFLDCKDMGGVGMMIAASCFAITAAAFVQILISGLNLSAQDAAWAKPVAMVIQSIIVIAAIIAVGGSSAIYAQNWDCQNRLIPDFKAKTSFDMNWGTYMLWVVVIISFAGAAIPPAMLYSPAPEVAEEAEPHEPAKDE